MTVLRSVLNSRRRFRASGAHSRITVSLANGFRVKLDGPFVPGQVSRGQITYPGYEHLKWEAVVQKMEPERLFSFTWHPYAIDAKTDYSKETPTLVEFRLEKTKTGTLLVLTESGFDKIPSDRRLEAFRMNDGGWTQQLTNIRSHVAQKS
jgi:uncharacterized protein YndB with AHSA1/START domain